jgi:predicted house-cleaning NTP pyrophosphatase (Maf/HAM1 superfamily)
LSAWFPVLRNSVARRSQQYVSAGARKRRRLALAPRDLPVLGADTIVILNGEVLEKPRDGGHAAEMLHAFRKDSSGDDRRGAG